jgi:basic amino acid/polyamine antiporter, APA family
MIDSSKSPSYKNSPPELSQIKPALTTVDAVSLIVGIVIGAGIFETPALVASATGSSLGVLLAWVAGGLVSLLGALCYAELATTYPNVGGNYHYLKLAYGRSVAFLFAWSRMTVVQTGSIALLAFVFGDYASQILPLGAASSSVYAAIAITLFTLINIMGLPQGRGIQNVLSAAKVVGLASVVIVGLLASAPSQPVVESTSSTNWGLAMVFVLLSYGGWNEAAYISAEVHHPRRNIVRSLLWGIGMISAIYLAINLAYLHGLGISKMTNSPAVAADLMRQVAGQPGVVFISVLVAVSTLGSLNATIFTGARTNFALGQDFELFQRMGQWQSQQSTPRVALVLQSAIALMLVVLGSITRNGFETMVEYTAPVFWFFFLLVGLSLIILRLQRGSSSDSFQVPFFPLTPIIFCCVCAYLLYSSLVYVNVGAIAGVIIVALGIPVLHWQNHR